jgi:chromate reductase
MISGVLKNTIEWLSRDKPETSVIKEKWAVIMGASDGRFGTVRAQNQLLELCAILQMKVHGRLRFPLAQAETVFDAKGDLIDADVRQRLEVFVSTIIDVLGNR